jgi:hypothetical protein
MNKKAFRPSMIILVSLLVLSAYGTGYSADFTFRVPVDLVNTQFNMARISCGVYGTVNGKVELIGSAYKDIFDYEIKNGNYNNTVEIGVSATYGMDPNLAESYGCDLLVATSGRISFIQTNDIEELMRADGPYPKDPAKPFRVSVRGSIPKSNMKRLNLHDVKPIKR